jgi:MraZ protein
MQGQSNERMTAPMTVFLSSYVNGVDKKGRVSVPASFRHEMAAHTRQQIVVYAAPDAGSNGGYLYGWAYDDFVKLAEKIQQLPALSPVRQRLARAILAAARPLNFDDAGRVMLPENLMQFAGLGEEVMFAGQGEYFTLWSPARYEAQMDDDGALTPEDLAAMEGVWK